MDKDKFLDYFDDQGSLVPPDTIEVDYIDVTPEMSYTHYTDTSSVLSSQDEENVESTGAKLSDAIDSLIQKFNLSIDNLEVSEVLDNLDTINSDDSAFDIVSSKIVKDYVSRVALKGVITQANLVNKVFERLDRTEINRIDGDTFLMLDKAFSYQDKLFQILDRYDRVGIDESLRHLSEVGDTGDSSETKLSKAEIRKLLERLSEGGK